MYECVTIKLRLETGVKDYAKGEKKKYITKKKDKAK